MALEDFAEALLRQQTGLASMGFADDTIERSPGWIDRMRTEEEARRQAYARAAQGLPPLQPSEGPIPRAATPIVAGVSPEPPSAESTRPAPARNPLAAPNAQALRGLVAGDPSVAYATAVRALADAEERKQLDAATLMANAVKTIPVRNREALLGTEQDKIRAIKERGGLDLLRQGDLTSMLPGFLRTMRTGNIDDGIGVFEKGLATLTAGERKDVEGKRLLESQFLRDKMLAGDKDFTDVQARNAAELQAKLAGLIGTVRPGAEKEIAKLQADQGQAVRLKQIEGADAMARTKVAAGASQGKNMTAQMQEYAEAMGLAGDKRSKTELMKEYLTKGRTQPEGGVSDAMKKTLFEMSNGDPLVMDAWVKYQNKEITVDQLEKQLQDIKAKRKK